MEISSVMSGIVSLLTRDVVGSITLNVALATFGTSRTAEPADRTGRSTLPSN